MSDTDVIAVLRVELANIEPLIWRRVAVRTTTSLQTLHRIGLNRPGFAGGPNS